MVGGFGHYGSASGTASSAVTVNTAVPAVTVTASASNILISQPLSVTVTVSGGTGNPAPTGTVILSGGSYISAATGLSAGTATINIPGGTLSAGEGHEHGTMHQVLRRRNKPLHFLWTEDRRQRRRPLQCLHKQQTQLCSIDSHPNALILA